MAAREKTINIGYIVVGLGGIFLSAIILLLDAKSLFIVPGLFLGYLIFLRPKLGLALTIIAVLNFQNLGRIGAASPLFFASAAKILGALTFASWLLYVLTKKEKIVFTRQMAWGGVFVLVSMFSIFFAEDKNVGLADFSKLFFNFLLYLLVANLVARGNPRNFVLLLVVTGFIASGVAMAQVLVPSFQFSGSESVVDFGAREGGIKNPEELQAGDFVRPTGTLGHPNWLSLFLVSLLPLTFYIFKSAVSLWSKNFALVCMIMQMVALVLTHDRMAFLGFVFVVGLSLWYRLLQVTRLTVVIFCAALILFPLVAPATYLERVFSPDNYRKSSSITTRWELLVGGLEIFEENWLAGVGVGNFGLVFMKEKKNTRTAEMVEWLRDQEGSTISDYHVGAHNMYVEVACETGIMGLFVFLAFLFKGVKDLRSLKSMRRANGLGQLPAALMISILGFSFLGLLLHAQLQKILWILMGLSAAVTWLASKENRQQTPAAPERLNPAMARSRNAPLTQK